MTLAEGGGGNWTQVEIRYCSRLLRKSTEFCLRGGVRGERGGGAEFHFVRDIHYVPPQ